jgi:DtxR family Mn-dependent transcriptional regulator
MVEAQPCEGVGASQTSPGLERYLEAIYVLQGDGETVIAARLAEHLGVTAPTVSQMLRRMTAEGLVRIDTGRVVQLTERGRELAEHIVRRHRLLERWLNDALGLDWVTAHEEAHRLEHSVSDLVMERLAQSLGYPKTCPHGNPIPGYGEARPGGLPLHQARAGDTVVIERILERVEDVRELLEFLQENGLVPGARLEVVAAGAYSGVVVRVGGRQVAVARDTAAMIWVHPA